MFRILQNSLITFILGSASFFVILELATRYNFNKYYIFIAYFFVLILFSLSQKKINTYIPKINLNLIKKALNDFSRPFWLRNSEGKILYKNQAFDKIFSENNSFNEQKFINLINPDNKKHIEDELPIGAKTFLGEELRISSNRFVGYLIDRTKYNQLKQELDLSLSSQKNLLDASNHAIAIYDNQTKLKYFNRNFINFWGLDEKWLNQKPSYSEILDNLRTKRKLPEQADFLAFKREQLKLFQNPPYDYKELLHVPDGSVVQVTLLTYDFGGLLFFYEDITSTLSLQRSYNSLIAIQKTILNNIKDGAAIFDEKGRLKFCNPSYLGIWNFTQSYVDANPYLSEIIDKLKSILSYPEEKWDDFKSDLLASLASSDNTKNHINLINGKVIKRISIPLPDNSHLITYSDITDSIIKEKRFIKNNDLLQESFALKNKLFIDVISELKIPIEKIQNQLNDKKENNLVQNQEYVLNNINYLEKMIEDIFDLSAIETDQKNLEVNLFDFNSILNLLQNQLEEKAKLQNIDFKFDCDQDLAMIIADEKRLKNIIRKLIILSMEIAGFNGLLHVKYAKNVKLDILINLKIHTNNLNLTESDFNFLIIKGFIELNGGKFEVKINNKEVNIKCVIPRGNEALISLLYKESLIENA